MNRIVTLTMNPCIDKSTSVNRVETENKLRCERPHFDPGGGGINVSRALRKLGGHSLALYPMGGPPGVMLKQFLEKEGVSQSPFLIQDWTRENFIVFEKSSELQYRFGLPGPGLYEAEWLTILRDLENLFPHPEYLVLSGSLPQRVPANFYARAVQIAKRQGSRVVLDAAKEPLKEAFREGVFLLKPNLVELEEIAGTALTDLVSQKRAALELIEEGVAEHIVVSLGGQGALGAVRGACYLVQAPQVKIQSKVGAGDSMVGGLVYGFSSGWDFKDSLRYGVACGTAAVMNRGTELCRLEDVEALFPRVTAFRL